MRSQPLPINQSELDDISAAERAIAAICQKYNVSLVGNYKIYSEDGDWDNPITSQTIDISVVSTRYEDRVRQHEQDLKANAEAKEKLDTQQFLEAMMEQYPNTRGLKLFEREWDEPTYFGHRPWRTTSVFIEGLSVKNWKLIRSLHLAIIQTGSGNTPSTRETTGYEQAFRCVLTPAPTSSRSIVTPARSKMAFMLPAAT